MPDTPAILNAAARVPPFALSAEAVARAYGRPPSRGARRFAAYDEDALTLATDAAALCLRATAPSHVRALYVASTTWPRAAAAQAERLAAALDLPPSVEIATFGGSWRGGATALHIALTRPTWPALVVAADRLTAPPGSERETELGDGAAAVLVGPGTGLARIASWTSTSEPIEWETPDARLIATHASRLASAAPRDGCARAAVSAPGPRAARAAAGALNLPSSLGAMEQIGFCGTAHPLLALVELLETARPGERALWLTCAEGSESATLEITATPTRTFGPALERARPMNEYGRWLASRSFFENGATANAFSSPALEQRDADFLMRLRGTRCASCGATHTLPAPACPRCGASEGFTRVPLSRAGTIFTFTHEHYVPSPTPPVTMAVVDLDGGGRLLVQVADAAPDDVRIGARVRLTLRRLHMGGGIPNYYWKAVLE
ncbi:MAG: OB-fold domain-containing protein [Planctomycetes bacterium]|nr:OB-fold domain-containing protein [Planctomycetota bacterium]